MAERHTNLTANLTENAYAKVDARENATGNADLLQRYEHALLGVFGTPLRPIVRGLGARVWDADGTCYLDLLGGIAVSSLGHGHPALVEAIAAQAARVVHVSNFFTTPAQVELAERLLRLAGAPAGSAAFFVNSGAEAIEASIKLSRRTGRTRIVVAQNAFHGRTTGALALTAKAAYREPFEPLLPDIVRVPYDDDEALSAAVTDDVAAVVLEPIQGEAGVVVPDPGYLRVAREVTRSHGALLVIDEIQTGVGRTGEWFAFSRSQIQPDVVTLAKGLAGGVPIGAMLTFGPQTTGLLAPGQHGTTFGGNPLACAAALAVLDTIESDGLLQQATTVGDHLQATVQALHHPAIHEVRGRGLLRAIELTSPLAKAVAAALLDAGFIVNPVTETALRLAPPLVVTTAEIDSFVAALATALERVGASPAPAGLR